MAIFEKDLEKISNLNEIYNKKNIKAELLQLTNIKLNSKVDIQFELDINLEKKYEKNKNFLSLINNNHIPFFLTTFNELSNKSKEIFKANEKLLYQINNEKDILLNTIDEISSKSNTFYINKLYDSTNSFDETVDFFNGNFLFNKKIINSFESINSQSYFENNFSILNNLFNSYNNFITKKNEVELNSSDKFKLILNSINTNLNDSNQIYKNINYLFKHYLSHSININQSNAKISNFKNYPISLSGLSQSIYNLIEQEEYFSNNALFYGIIPFTKINQFDSSLLIDFPIFKKSFNIEYFPLKYLNRKNILSIENNNFKNDLFKYMQSRFDDQNITKLISTDENELINSNKIFLKNNLINNTSIMNMINISNQNELEGFCNISIQHKSSSNYLENLSSNKFHNYFNIFKNKKVSNSQDNSIIIVDNTIDHQNIKEDVVNNFNLYKNFKNNSKISNLNLLQLIASKINSNNLKIVSIDTKTTKVIKNIFGINEDRLEQNRTIQQRQNLEEISNNIITGKIKSINQSLLSESNILLENSTNNLNLNTNNLNQSTIKSRGAIPKSISNVNVTQQVNTNINTQNILGSQAQQQNLIRNLDANNIDIVTYKAKNIIEDAKGLSNFSFFDESNNFSSNIIKNRFLINDSNKKAKKIISQLNLRSRFINQSLTNIENEKIFSNLNDRITYIVPNTSEIKVLFKKFEDLNNINNFYNQIYFEDTLSILRNKNNNDGIILNENFILKNKSFMNESSIKYNVDNFINKNDDFVDLSKNLTENYVNENYNNNDFSFLDNFFNKEKLKHFANSYDTFNFIVEECKNYILDNLDNNDNLNNFSKKSNILETACLLWLLSSQSDFKDKNLKNNLKNDLIDVLLYENILKIKNINNNTINNEIKEQKRNILLNALTPDHISDISGFYTYSPSLNINEYSNFNPYEVKGKNNFYNTFEQNGLFYHFLFSNAHQSKQYYYNDETMNNNNIIEKDNTFNILNYISSPLCFYQNDIDDNIQFKNIFNVGYNNLLDLNSNDLFNIFLPYIEYSIINEKPCFIISLRADDTQDFTMFKIKLRRFLYAIKDKNFTENNTIFLKNIDNLIEKIDNNQLIFRKNILNKSNVNKSFLNNNDTFISIFTNKLFDFQEINTVINNLNIRSFNEFKNLNNNLVIEMRNILESSLISCSDIFAKMFIDLQSYNSLCNRIFDANFFYNNEKKNDISSKSNKVILNFVRGTKFLNLDYDNDIYKDTINYKKTLNENLTRFNQNYFENELYEFNQIDLSTKNIALSESVYKNTKKLKPSEHKFFYFLENILGIKNEDIIKIYTYLKIDPNQFSKNINIFENFNLYSFPLKRILKLYYKNNNSISFENDISTFIYDFLFEEAIINQNLGNTLFDSQGDVNFINKNRIVSNTNDLIIKVTNSLNEYLSLNNFIRGEFNVNFAKSLELKCADNFTFNEINIFENNITLKDIFEYIIAPSFSLNKNFYNFETGDNIDNFKVISGCENIIEDTNYLNLQNNPYIIKNKRYNNNDNLFKNILENYFKQYGNFTPTIDIDFNKKYIDLNHNWYNQIARSLILNDTITATNMEIIKYYNSYEKGLGFDSFKQYQYLQQNRTNAPGLNLTGLKENIFNSYNFLNENTPISNFKLKKNNFNLKKSYIKNFLQTKKSRNIFDDIINGELLNNNVDKTIRNILNSNEKSLILSNFKDFYIQKFNNKKWYSNNEFMFIENYSISTDKQYILNQTRNLDNCDILTIGVENNNINFENNDIIVLTVEMIDHDYPDIIWEPKKFEFDMSLDDIDDELLQLSQKIKSSNELIRDSNDFLNVPLIDYNMIFEDEQLLKNLISDISQVDNENYTNNIGSLIQQKFMSTGINGNIIRIIDKRINVLKEKFNKIKLINNFTDIEFTNLMYSIVKKCIYNQKMNLKIKKYLKLTNGFEPNIEFSLKENNELSNLIVLNEIYELYVNNIFSNIDNSSEYSLGFTREELDNAFKLEQLNDENTYSIFGYNFKIASLSSNQKINQFIKFMADLTKSIVPRYDVMTNPNFRKIINVAVNPSDFVVSYIQDKNHDLVEFALNNHDLIFKPLNRNNEIYDEWDNLYDDLNRKILLKNNISSNYFNIFKKSTNEKYVPKNISYRIKIDLLD